MAGLVCNHRRYRQRLPSLPNLSISNYEVDEQQGTTHLHDVSLDGPNYENPVSFDWTTRDDGSATGGHGLRGLQSDSVHHQLRGQHQAVYSDIAIIDDTDPEPDETFSIVLSNLTNAQPRRAPREL